MSHTKGPWEAWISDSMVEVRAPSGPPAVSWMGFDDSDRPIKEHAANARLIAAAPELLAACEGFVEYEGENEEEGMPAYNAMKLAIIAAIAKAEGKP